MTQKDTPSIHGKEDTFVSAVIYLHDNADHITEFMESLNRCLSSNFKHYEIICVDDFCQDDTMRLLREAAAALNPPVLSILHMSFYQGMELAMGAGVNLAIGDFVFEFDSVVIDYPETMIMESYRHSLPGIDIVSVSSERSGRLSSKLFYALFNRFSSAPFELESEAFRVTSRRAINRIHSMGNVIPYRKAMYANCGLKQATLRYAADKSVETCRSPELRKFRSNLALEAMIFHTDFVYRLVLSIAVAMLFLTLFACIYTGVVFLSAHAIPGWTTTMLVISSCFCALFGIMAFVVKYLSILVDLSFRRKRYVTESLEKIAGYECNPGGAVGGDANG